MPCLPSRRRAALHSPPPHPHIDARVSRPAFVALRLGLLALAAWALRREVADVKLGDLLRQFADYGWRHATLSLAGTIASFATLGLIELRATRYAGAARIPRRTVIATALVANAVSQSIGLALLTGAAVRLRAYARRGVDAIAVARISGFVTVTITLGLLTCGATVLLAGGEPLRVGQATLPVRPAGALLALTVVAYLAWSAVASRDHIGRGRWLLRRPTLRVALAQIGLSSLDWLITGTVLFAVLPTAGGVEYGQLLRAYLVAQTAGMASHVPGGAGVFEAMMLTLLTPAGATQRAALIAGLVMFRVVYYLLPLVSALVVAGVTELLPGRRTARLGTEPRVAHVP